LVADLLLFRLGRNGVMGNMYFAYYGYLAVVLAAVKAAVAAIPPPIMTTSCYIIASSLEALD
jgi:hypothetical protein